MKRLGAAALWLVACQRAEPVAPIVLDLPEGIATRGSTSERLTRASGTLSVLLVLLGLGLLWMVFGK